MPRANVQSIDVKPIEVPGAVYCPICTRTVQARVLHARKGDRVMPGQRCPRCSSSLDAGYVVAIDRAA